MIEKILIDYLTQELSVPVYLERPVDPPSRFVIIQKTGSTKFNHLCTATMAFQSYAETLYEAATLNVEVISAVENSITLPEISAAKLNSDYNFTNTAMKQYRYQAVFNITHY